MASQRDAVASDISRDGISSSSSDLAIKEAATAIDVEGGEGSSVSQELESAAPPPYTAFPRSRQLFIVLIATAAGFFSPICGAVYLPSLILFEKIFHTTSRVINASVTVYWAIFGIAPLFGAAASDYGGRKTIYIVSLALFLGANALLAALPPNLGALFTLRVFQALGASMVTSVGAGTVADVTEPAKRASRMGIFLLGPQLGPLLGPLIGGQFSDESRWRWIFGFLSVACFPVYVLILFFLPETLRCLVGNGSIYAAKSWIVRPRLRQKPVVEDGEFPKPPRPTVKGFLKILLFVPNGIVSVASAFNFAGLSSIYIAFPRVWQTEYGFSGSETGYAYLAPGITLLFASLIIGRLSDLQHRRYKAKNNGVAPPPEQRLEGQVWAYLIAAAGKAMFGWFTERHYHPSAGLVASSLSAVGTGIIMVLSTSYQTECMPMAAALLVALSGMLRNVGAAISAAIIASLIDSMGYGWFFTGLSILDLLCVGGLLFIRVRGHVYRAKLSTPPKSEAAGITTVGK
ncbi:MFS general substrate transporter [Lindgomyces ingoldianus]|uniref:MFS general substrate transporter n=1 Tax=Lindgomyces ingoldianus TaxID=673940 RepID=A0ACB6RBN9_9PLEO|nr:MFS general substrate transporter [Lindgomyces ingoldianus]KAF2475881.1 MFS general substrate transporter [Lindgomyces ingoldianus]